MRWSYHSLGKAGEGCLEKPHKTAEIVTNKNEEGNIKKKKTGIEGTVTDFAIRWAALKELGRWVEKEGGLGLVCREGLEATSGQVEKQEAFKL